MKILYTSDLHVNERHYQRLLELQRNQRIDCLIIGGDLIPNSPGFHDRIHNQRDFIKQFLYPYISKLKTTKPIPKLKIIFFQQGFMLKYYTT